MNWVLQAIFVYVFKKTEEPFGKHFSSNYLKSRLEQISFEYTKKGLQKPVVVADSGLLSKENINALQKEEYEYIVGTRIKNETKIVKNNDNKKCTGNRR